jgi:hypothetical protein
MGIKKTAMTSALALAAGIAAVPVATGYPAPDLPSFLMLRFAMIQTPGSCDEGVCKSPANDHPDEPNFANAAASVHDPDN